VISEETQTRNAFIFAHEATLGVFEIDQHSRAVTRALEARKTCVLTQNVKLFLASVPEDALE